MRMRLRAISLVSLINVRRLGRNEGGGWHGLAALRNKRSAAERACIQCDTANHDARYTTTADQRRTMYWMGCRQLQCV